MIEEANALPAACTTVYFVPSENANPELLLFEEKLILGSGGWKRSGDKGRKWRQQLREWYEKYSIDLFAPDRFVRKLSDLKRITVLLCSPIDPFLVRERLRKIVRDRKYHHLRWMIIDILLLPVSLL